jgi:mRNA interferase RelE/StbE
MSYDVRVHPQVKDDFSALDPPIRNRIKERISNRLTEKPEYFGEPLRGTLNDFWKFRLGDYRIVFDIDQENELISIFNLAHRKEAYERVKRRIE